MLLESAPIDSLNKFELYERVVVAPAWVHEIKINKLRRMF